MKVFFVSILSTFLFSVLMGCDSTPVASDVSQREANRIVALLHKNGISADLHSGRIGKGRFEVLVPEAVFPNAATILSARGLPSERQPSFEEMTASNGIIPTSREVDNLRLDRALAAELEELFSMNSSVQNVGAIVRMHSVRSLQDASITVALELSSKGNLSKEEIEEVVRKAFPTIDASRIYVKAFRVESDVDGDHVDGEEVPFLILWRVPSSLYTSLASLFFGMVLFAGVVFGATGYLIGQYLSLRRNGSMRGLSRLAPRGIQQKSELGSLQDEMQDGSDS